jgi:hypothetical protein
MTGSKGRIAVLLVVLGLGSAPAAAPRTPARPLAWLPPLAAAAVPRPGAWVQYSVVPSKGLPMLLRLAALEREGSASWVEVGITDAMRRTLTLRLLLEGSLASPKRVLRAVVQPHGQQPFYLPDGLAAQQLPPFRAGAGPGAQRAGRVRVTVPAGSFTAEHVRSREKGKLVEAWFSAQVAGWPMVKLKTPDLLLELVAHGEKATSQIRGKPAKMSDELWRGLGGGP